MSSQTVTTAIGTETYFETPNISMPDAMPANSENVVATLPTSRANMASAARRMPNRSRMSAAKPLPVVAPMRLAVVCTTMSRMHMMGMTHSVVKPNFAPAVEYVEMPPASLPAMAVTMPGPIAARMSNSRFFFLPSWPSVSKAVVLLGSAAPAAFFCLPLTPKALPGMGARVFAAPFAASAFFFPNTMAYLQE